VCYTSIVNGEYTTTDPEIIERASHLLLRLEELAADALELIEDLRHESNTNALYGYEEQD